MPYLVVRSSAQDVTVYEEQNGQWQVESIAHVALGPNVKIALDGDFMTVINDITPTLLQRKRS